MANLFQYAYTMERRFEEFLSDNGKGERKTTFMLDFSIADCFGNKAVTDTFKRAFKEWKNDVIYMAEFVCVLNPKIGNTMVATTDWQGCTTSCGARLIMLA